MVPAITVLMSVHNGKRFLKKAIDSILAQTYQEFEFIIIDDASDDGAQVMLNLYAQSDPRIRLIRNKERQGRGANLRHGILQARGQWIAQADADDFYMPHRLQTQLDYVRNHPFIDVLSGSVIEIDEQGIEQRTRHMPLHHEEIIRHIGACPITHSLVFFNKDRILEAGSYGSEPYRNDYALWFRAIKAGLCFANLAEPLGYYRTGNGYFHRKSLKLLLAQIKIGWRGCKLINAPFTAYFMVSTPLLYHFMPSFIQRLKTHKSMG